MDNVPFQFCQSVCSHKVHLIEREEKKDFSPSTFNFDSFPWNVAFQEHFERRSLGHLSIVADSEILFYVQTDELSLENPTRNGLEDAHFDNHFQISSIEIRYEKDLIPEEEQEKEISEILAYLGPYMNNVELLSIGQFTHRILKYVPSHCFAHIDLMCLKEDSTPLICNILEHSRLDTLRLEGRLHRSVVPSIEKCLLKGQLTACDLEDSKLELSTDFLEKLIASRLQSPKHAYYRFKMDTASVAHIHPEHQTHYTDQSTWNLGAAGSVHVFYASESMNEEGFIEQMVFHVVLFYLLYCLLKF